MKKLSESFNRSNELQTESEQIDQFASKYINLLEEFGVSSITELDEERLDQFHETMLSDKLESSLSKR